MVKGAKMEEGRRRWDKKGRGEGMRRRGSGRCRAKIKHRVEGDVEERHRVGKSGSLCRRCRMPRLESGMRLSHNCNRLSRFERDTGRARSLTQNDRDAALSAEASFWISVDVRFG